VYPPLFARAAADLPGPRRHAAVNGQDDADLRRPATSGSS
jgi:hypothetical protein